MKRLWLAVWILVVTSSLCVVTLLHQQRQIRILMTELDAVVDTFNSGDIQHAYRMALTLEEDYQHRTRTFPLFMAHEELHACREALALLPSILRDDNAEEFHMESTRCRILLERLATSELPFPENVF